jgi:hypothetical protein
MDVQYARNVEVRVSLPGGLVVGLKRLHSARSGGQASRSGQTVEDADFGWPRPRAFTRLRTPGDRPSAARKRVDRRESFG